jgi:hypothetical protein
MCEVFTGKGYICVGVNIRRCAKSRRGRRVVTSTLLGLVRTLNLPLEHLETRSDLNGNQAYLSGNRVQNCIDNWRGTVLGVSRSIRN